MDGRSTYGVSRRWAWPLCGVVLSAVLLVGCTATPDEQAPDQQAAGQQNTDPLPAQTIPAPGGGSVHETVAPAEPAPTVSTSMKKPADVGGGITVDVAHVRRLAVKAKTPGEIAGPAVAITLTVDNAGKKPVDLSTAMVSVTGSDGAYGQPTTSDPYAPFTGPVEAGGSESGTYVFRLPADQRKSLSVTVEYVAGAPIALFVGKAK